jgi:hypothetical protein
VDRLLTAGRVGLCLAVPREYERPAGPRSRRRVLRGGPRPPGRGAKERAAEPNRPGWWDGAELRLAPARLVAGWEKPEAPPALPTAEEYTHTAPGVNSDGL